MLTCGCNRRVKKQPGQLGMSLVYSSHGASHGLSSLPVLLLIDGLRQIDALCLGEEYDGHMLSQLPCRMCLHEGGLVRLGPSSVHKTQLYLHHLRSILW